MHIIQVSRRKTAVPETWEPIPTPPVWRAGPWVVAATIAVWIALWGVSMLMAPMVWRAMMVVTGHG